MKRIALSFALIILTPAFNTDCQPTPNYDKELEVITNNIVFSTFATVNTVSILHNFVLHCSQEQARAAWKKIFVGAQLNTSQLKQTRDILRKWHQMISSDRLIKKISVGAYLLKKDVQGFLGTELTTKLLSIIDSTTIKAYRTMLDTGITTAQELLNAQAAQ